MLLDFKHGAHALLELTAETRTLAAKRSDVVLPQLAGADFDEDAMTPFRYLLTRADDLLPESPETVDALDALGDAMIDQSVGETDSRIPPIYTYWSQSIDHELTARTDRTTETSDITLERSALAPAARTTVEKDLLNRRTPALELDCLYGDGPPGEYGEKVRRIERLDLARKLRDGASMRIGEATDVGNTPPPESDLRRDLPRIGPLLERGVVREQDFAEELRAKPNFRQLALIGDPRNDENLVVAQFHLALLRFHNAVVQQLQEQDRSRGENEDALFERARKIARWVFQWLVVNDFLKTVARADVVERVLAERAPVYRSRFEEVYRPFMAVEFSVAAYRFGHSMIRGAYDYNRNFGRGADGGDGTFARVARLDQLFEFTGRFTGRSPEGEGEPFEPAPPLGGTPTLPSNWIIEWERWDGRSPEPGRVARKIDTRVSPPLDRMINEGNEGEETRVRKLLKHLARRNLRRGYQLSLRTGQAAARALEVAALSREELSTGNSERMNDVLEQGGFFDRTPLWFYVLKEAEVQEEGERLGQVGSRLVAETIIGVLTVDPESYLTKEISWDPSKKTPDAGGPLHLPDGRTISKIGDLLEFAGVLPPAA